MAGFSGKSKLPQEQSGQQATASLSATTVVVDRCEDDYEDGDFATPKHDRYGTDDEPL
jgi:hypothetical protein